nr:hypothetical protein [Candidatus Enterousia merdequi]
MRKTRTTKMIIKHKYLLLFLSAFITYGAFDGTCAALDLSSITNATNIADALKKYKDISASLLNDNKNISEDAKSNAKKWIEEDIKAATDLYGKKADEITQEQQEQETTTEEQKAADEKAKKEAELKEKEDAYKAAKEKEQSTANKMLSAATIGATGLGAMELAEGLSEKKADEKAEADMAAYIATMRCTYANGKSVKAGSEEIELPGANNQELYKYRNEYTTLAADLKERKEILGLKPGIESEEILDKFAMGLYDDENVGITAGSYGSLYRANMLNSETDQEKLAANKEEASKRIKGGAIAVGAGTLVGVVGNSLINGKLGEKLKEALNKKEAGKETVALLKKEAQALQNLKKCIDRANNNNITDITSLNFENFYPSVLSIGSAEKCTSSAKSATSAQDLFVDSTNATEIYEKLVTSFDEKTANKMIGVKDNTPKDSAIKELQTKIENIQKKYKEAEEKDKKTAEGLGISIGRISGSADGDGLKNLTALFNNTGSDSKFDLSSFLNK